MVAQDHATSAFPLTSYTYIERNPTKYSFMAHRQEIWKYVRCPAIPHSGRRAFFLYSGIFSMILDPNLGEKKTNQTKNSHYLTICFFLSMLTSVWVPWWIYAEGVRHIEIASWYETKTRNKIDPSSRDLKWCGVQMWKIYNCVRIKKIEQGY